jgi:uncharacterized protein (TIGR02145 family)
MDFRFYLINERTGVQLEIEEPVNFDNFKPVLRRDAKFHGVNFEFAEQNLGFYGKAYKFVTEEYKVYGVDGILIFLVEYNCNGGWLEFYKGSLDYKRYEEVIGDYCIVNVGIAQLGVPMTLKNRMETKVDLSTTTGMEGASLPAYANLGKEISVPSKTVLLNNSAKKDDTSAVISLTHDNTLFSIPFGNIILNEINDFNPDNDFYEISTPIARPIFVNNTKLTISSFEFRASTFFRMHGNNYSVFLNALIEFIVYNSKNNKLGTVYNKSISQYLTIQGGSFYYATSPNVSWGQGDFMQGREIPPGGKLVAMVNITNMSKYDNAGISVEGSFIELKLNSRSNSTPIKTFAIHESLNRIVESTTNNALTVKSDYYGRSDSEVNPTQADGVGSLRCITNGYFIRRAKLTTGEPILSISFKDLLDGLNAIDAIGYSIEGNKLRIEPWEYFYTDDVILRCTGINEVKRKIDPERCFQLVDIGYDKWESEEWNSIDGFHSKRQYRTKIKNIDTKLEQFCKFIADSYAIEATRRKGVENPTGDWKYDNNTFIIDLIRDANNSLVVNTGNGDESTLIDPSTVFNVELSPARMAARWFSRIMQGVKPETGDKLIFTGSEGYIGAKTTSKHANSVTTEEVSERQDWDISKIINRNPIPKFNPELVEFDYPLTAAEFMAIRNNPNGLIEFDGEYGWIKEIEADLLEGTAKFTLIPKVNLNRVDNLITINASYSESENGVYIRLSSSFLVANDIAFLINSKSYYNENLKEDNDYSLIIEKGNFVSNQIFIPNISGINKMQFIIEDITPIEDVYFNYIAVGSVIVGIPYERYFFSANIQNQAPQGVYLPGLQGWDGMPNPTESKKPYVIDSENPIYAKWRDPSGGKVYRLVLMPDSYWWFAQNCDRDSNNGWLLNEAGRASYGNYFEPDYHLLFATPEGWKVPTKEQWSNLFTIIGGSSTAGRKLKSTPNTRDNGSNSDTNPTWGYANDNVLGADDYGFGVLPAGMYYVPITVPSYISGRSGKAYFWTDTSEDEENRYIVYFSNDSTEAKIYTLKINSEYGTNSGLSVRFIKQ